MIYVVRYKSNNICTISITGKLQNSDKRNQRIIEINYDTVHIHG